MKLVSSHSCQKLQAQPHRSTQPRLGPPSQGHSAGASHNTPSLLGLLAAAFSMAQASADPDLQQKILQALKDGSPVKTAKLVKECQVSKKELNQVLYQMKNKSQVVPAGPGTWRLGSGEAGEMVPVALAQPSPAERPRQDIVAIPRRPGSGLSEQQEQIYRFLEFSGPHKALGIAQSLGMKRAKEVNPDLYAMRNKHLLNFDQNSNAWTIYQPEDARERSQPSTVVYQHNPVMICQSGPNSHISIESSEAVQIGHGNSIVRQVAPGESGSTAPLYLPPSAPADPSTQDPLAGSWGPQDIRIEESVLRRVQLGHGNEMSLLSTLAVGPDHSPSVSTSVSATTAGPEASFEIRMPTPGPHLEEEKDVTQRVHIKSCFLEDTAIGNSNRMNISLGAASPGGGPGPEDSSREPGEPAEDAEPQSEAAEPRDEFPPDAGHADPDLSTFTSQLEAMTLESRDSETGEEGPRVD